MPRFLIDVNLPRRFSLWATPDFQFMHDIGPTWGDPKIWDFALANGFVIVTNDADFSDRAQLAAVAPVIVHLRLGNMRMRAWHATLTRLWPDILVAIETARIVRVYQDRLEMIE